MEYISNQNSWKLILTISEDILIGGQVLLQDSKKPVNDIPIQETKNIKTFLKKRYVKIIHISITIVRRRSGNYT